MHIYTEAETETYAYTNSVTYIFVYKNTHARKYMSYNYT